MISRLARNVLWASCIVIPCGAFWPESSGALIKECIDLNSRIKEKVNLRHLDDAEQMVSAALKNDAAPLQPVCAGVILTNVAAGMLTAGRLDRAGTLAEVAIRYFDKVLPPNHPAYLGPLHTLASVQLDQGRTGKARQTVQRMQLIREESPLAR